VALGIGSIELVTVAHDRFGLTDVVSSGIARLDLHNVGYLIAGLFVLTWAAAVAFWKLGRVEERWSPAPLEGRES
jgi:high-affinity nickel-transport protein